MAKIYEYTPRRRMIMQVIMWVILIATVGLAALVDRTISRHDRVSLGPVQTIGPLHFSLPANWVVQRRHDPQVAVVANEAVMASPRILMIYRWHLGKQMSADDYLEGSGLLSDIFGEIQPDVDETTLDGVRALRLRGQGVIERAEGTIVRSELVIAAVFPNRQAVTLRLSKFGELQSADLTLLDQVAASVKIDGVP